jgi:hypothetical protein
VIGVGLVREDNCQDRGGGGRGGGGGTPPLYRVHGDKVKVKVTSGENDLEMNYILVR